MSFKTSEYSYILSQTGNFRQFTVWNITYTQSTGSCLYSLLTKCLLLKGVLNLKTASVHQRSSLLSPYQSGTAASVVDLLTRDVKETVKVSCKNYLLFNRAALFIYIYGSTTSAAYIIFIFMPINEVKTGIDGLIFAGH